MRGYSSAEEAMRNPITEPLLSSKQKDACLAFLLGEAVKSNSSDALPYKASIDPSQLDTCLETRPNGTKIAWYPYPLSMIKMIPDGRTFLGFYGSAIHIVRVEF